MRKRLKKEAVIILLGLLLVLTACGKEKKLIKEDDISITLTDDFVKKDKKNTNWYYESTDAIVMGIKETDDDLEKNGLEINSLSDYVHEIMDANEITAEVYQRNDENYYYYKYNKKVEGTKYSYLVCVFENGDEYWTINFACYEQRYKQLGKQFLKWADSVSFE